MSTRQAKMAEDDATFNEPGTKLATSDLTLSTIAKHDIRRFRSTSLTAHPWSKRLGQLSSHVKICGRMMLAERLQVSGIFRRSESPGFGVKCDPAFQLFRLARRYFQDGHRRELTSAMQSPNQMLRRALVMIKEGISICRASSSGISVKKPPG